MYFNFLNSGILPSGSAEPRCNQLFFEDVSDVFFEPILSGVSASIPGGSTSALPIDRFTDALGSYGIYGRFELLRCEINTRKAAVRPCS
jgi:hypothetical protein